MANSTSPATTLLHRGVLRIGGVDRAHLLQGLISNDINLCSPQKSIYAALLTPQGKFLHDFFIFNASDAFLIDCEAARADDLLHRLSSYKLRAKVTLEDVSDAVDVVALLSDELYHETGLVPLPFLREGLGAGQDVQRLSELSNFNAKPSPDPSRKNGRGAPTSPTAHDFQPLLFPDPRLAALGSRGIVPKDEFKTTDRAIYDRHRLTLGIPDGSLDMIVGKSTLLDGNFDFLNGISWTKGCYVGQELTARMHHRTLVKKRMFPVKISGVAPASGSIIHHNGTEIGEMRSSNGDLGLALLNVEQAKVAIKDGKALTCSTSTLTPTQPGWLMLS